MAPVRGVRCGIFNTSIPIPFATRSNIVPNLTSSRMRYRGAVRNCVAFRKRCATDASVGAGVTSIWTREREANSTMTVARQLCPHPKTNAFATVTVSQRGQGNGRERNNSR